MTILLVARKYNIKSPEVIGGVIVSSENLIRFFNEHDVNYLFVDTNKKAYFNKLLSLFAINFKILRRISKVEHIALNLSDLELVLIAPLAVYFASLKRKKVSLRVFGGNFHEIHNRNYFFKKAIDFVLSRCSLLFLQTNDLVGKYQNRYRTIHLPTCRYTVSIVKRRTYRNKFVFAGQLKRTKGVQFILRLAEKLKDIRIDFVGALEEYSKDELSTKNTMYRGALPPQSLTEVLSEYDFLLFPTIHPGEGYPGIIIEGYAAGVPVLTNRWRSIPELVDDGETGFLFTPNDLDGYCSVIENMNDKKYQYLRENSLKKFEQFDCNTVYGKYLHHIKQLN